MYIIKMNKKKLTIFYWKSVSKYISNYVKKYFIYFILKLNYDVYKSNTSKF